MVANPDITPGFGVTSGWAVILPEPRKICDHAMALSALLVHARLQAAMPEKRHRLFQQPQGVALSELTCHIVPLSSVNKRFAATKSYK
jgi:hypothetical protein